jgi:hypothetical protein
MPSHYRLIVFLVILLAAALVGFYYKSLASPGTEPARFRSQAPQKLRLYFRAGNMVSDNVAIELHANRTLNMQGYTHFDETVTVDVTYSHPASQKTIIMASDSRPAETVTLINGVVQMVRPNFIETRLPGERFMVAVPLSPARPPGRHGQKTYIAEQNFQSIPVVFDSNGSIYGHLPSVSIENNLFGALSNMSVLFAPKTGELQRARANVCHTLGGSFPGWKCFFEQTAFSPAKYVASEYLDNVGAELNNEQVAYMNPSTTANNFNYVWRSITCCNLEPVFKLTDPTAADSQSKAAFTSGIAFGVAGAALIAVFQELPKKLSWRRRKRAGKSTPQDA